MKAKRKWGIIGAVLIIITLLYFYKLPYYYRGNIKGGYGEVYMNDVVGKIKVTGKPISLEALGSLKGREAITFSTKVEITQDKLNEWRETEVRLQVLDLSLVFNDEKLPFEIAQIKKVEVKIGDEYTMYETDGNFSGTYDQISGKLVGGDRKPLILLLNHEIFSHKKNWKVYCDVSVTLNNANDFEETYTFRCPLKAALF